MIKQIKDGVRFCHYDSIADALSTPMPNEANERRFNDRYLSGKSALNNGGAEKWHGDRDITTGAKAIEVFAKGWPKGLARANKELGKIEGFTQEQAHQLYQDLGLGALKYFLLKVDPKKRMLFDPKESIQFQGNTGPFIQYTYARIASILRRAKELKVTSEFSHTIALSPTEIEGIYLISEFENKIEESAKEYSPALIAQYIYDLAKEYNRFYAELPIFKESDKNIMSFRVAYSDATAEVIKKGMGLLGINVPNRM